MGRYQKNLIEHIEKNPHWIRPENYRNEVISFLKQPLEDLCISRPKSRLKWGIELPFDNNYVTYVWFDALLNYLNAAGWPEKFNKDLWVSCHHLLAKDILKTHATYWPPMLFALGVPMFAELDVHGYWLVDGDKMSKSLGNVIRPLEVEEKYGRESLRFYLLKEMSFGLDSTFKLEAFVHSINAHLANGIGNLASRVLTLCAKNFKGKWDAKKLELTDKNLLDTRKTLLESWDKGFNEIKFQNALKAWADFITQVDLYVNETKPWALAKDPTQTERLQIVLGTCLQALITAATVIYPVLPEASVKLLTALGIKQDPAKDIALALHTQDSFTLSTEVPKLFMRVQLPTQEEK